MPKTHRGQYVERVINTKELSGGGTLVTEYLVAPIFIMGHLFVVPKADSDGAPYIGPAAWLSVVERELRLAQMNYVAGYGWKQVGPDRWRFATTLAPDGSEDVLIKEHLTSLSGAVVLTKMWFGAKDHDAREGLIDIEIPLTGTGDTANGS